MDTRENGVFHYTSEGRFSVFMTSYIPRNLMFLSKNIRSLHWKNLHNLRFTITHGVINPPRENGALLLLLATGSVFSVVNAIDFNSNVTSFLAVSSKLNGTHHKSKGFRESFVWHTTLVRLDGCQSHDTGASVSSSLQECCALIHSSSYTPATSPSSLWSSWFGGCSPCGLYRGGPNTPPPR